jgi:hypothetical protein
LIHPVQIAPELTGTRNSTCSDAVHQHRQSRGICGA